MRLLIVTQKVDRADPILGFFHAWIAGFAARADHVTVIGQSVGDRDLPGNVTVLSLGKEAGHPTFFQVVRFWKLIWNGRKGYDAVLVHMTPIWVVLGGPLWILLGKRMYLWYEARGTRWPLRIALMMVRKVFSASASGMPLRSAKSIVTGHGIDTGLFRPPEDPSVRKRNSLVTVSRMTRAKRLDVILRALADLPDCHLDMIGAALTPEDQQTEQSLHVLASTLHIHKRIRDVRSLRPADLVGELQQATMFLHASETPLDKALLEAMSCGCLVVSCADAAKDVLPVDCVTAPDTMAERARALLDLPADDENRLRQTLRGIVVQHHSLPRLLDRLVREMSA